MIELAEKKAKEGEKPLNVDDIFTGDTIESVMKEAQAEAHESFVRIIKGERGCGKKCNKEHGKTICLVCDYYYYSPYHSYNHSGHTCTYSEDAGKRGSFPI
jgi:hypothetical protein